MILEKDCLKVFNNLVFIIYFCNICEMIYIILNVQLITNTKHIIQLYVASFLFLHL